MKKIENDMAGGGVIKNMISFAQLFLCPLLQKFNFSSPGI